MDFAITANSVIDLIALKVPVQQISNRFRTCSNLVVTSESNYGYLHSVINGEQVITKLFAELEPCCDNGNEKFCNVL